MRPAPLAESFSFVVFLINTLFENKIFKNQFCFLASPLKSAILYIGDFSYQKFLASRVRFNRTFVSRRGDEPDKPFA